MIPRGPRGDEELLFNGYRVSVLKITKVLEINGSNFFDGDNYCTTVFLKCPKLYT